jgi:hypothetical protein
MSSPILPVEGPLDLPTVTPPAGSDHAGPSMLPSELAARDTRFELIASRGGPPREVLEQIAAAARIHDELRDSGQQLHFLSAAAGERTRIELHDSDGNAVRTLSTVEAFELAAGAALR